MTATLFLMGNVAKGKKEKGVETQLAPVARVKKGVGNPSLSYSIIQIYSGGKGGEGMKGQSHTLRRMLKKEKKDRPSFYLLAEREEGKGRTTNL